MWHDSYVTWLMPHMWFQIPQNKYLPCPPTLWKFAKRHPILGFGVQRVGSRASVRHTATHCNTLQHTATHCNTLQHTATHCNTLQRLEQVIDTLQHTATHCNTLQHTATHCNTLQRLEQVIVTLSTASEYHKPHKDSCDWQDWGLTLEALPPRGGGSAGCPEKGQEESETGE